MRLKHWGFVKVRHLVILKGTLKGKLKEILMQKGFEKGKLKGKLMVKQTGLLMEKPKLREIVRVTQMVTQMEKRWEIQKD